MKTRKPIRVLTFSFFLLMISFFVAWQSGWLSSLFAEEEKPYESILKNIPDSVKPMDMVAFNEATSRMKDSLDSVAQSHKPKLRIFYGEDIHLQEVYMMSSSKTFIMADPNDELRKHIFPGGQIRSLIPPDQNPAKVGPKR